MAREAARQMSCTNNLRQVAIAVHQYHDARNQFPAGTHNAVVVGGVPTGGTTVFVELLPYIEQPKLFEKWDYVDNRNNVAGGKDATQAQVIKILLCASDRLPEKVVFHATVTGGAALEWSWGHYGMSSYGGNGGLRTFHGGPAPDYPRLSRDGIFSVDSSIRLAQVIDGTSNTFLFGERYHLDRQHDLQREINSSTIGPLAGWGKWGYVAIGTGQVTLSTPVRINFRVPSKDVVPLDMENRYCAFGSGHADGANFAFADGSTKFVSEAPPLATLQALSTRAGGEVVADW
jgi:prepilin-type processing-associated H-X9-DG protein